MNIVETLLKSVSARSGEKSKQIFLDRFLQSRFADQLKKPLLTHDDKKKLKTTTSSFKHIPYKDISYLKIENNSASEVTISLSENITSKLSSLEQAFELFINFTSHSNALGDFRKYSNIYHHLYCTSRYVFFHGDGNCVTLGVLLYCFLEHFFKKNTIALYYCCGLQREFMHVYALTTSSSQKYFVDPDQKIYCPYETLDSVYSPGLIYQLLSGAGFHVYDLIPQEKRNKLFYAMTNELMDEYRILPGPIIYRDNPYLGNYSTLFSTARRLNSQSLDILANDYQWKAAYREIGNQCYQTDLPFLAKIKERSLFQLPANASLSFGINDPIPQEVKDLCLIFFGRIPATITWEIQPEEVHELKLPDMPWLIYFEPNIKICQFQNQKFNLHESACKKYGYIGMGDIEKIMGITGNNLTLSLASFTRSKINVVLPFNALALNADIIAFHSEHEKELIMSYVV